MKHGQLRAFVHNIAESLASGASYLSQDYGYFIYQDAEQLLGGKLTVDFLNGTVVEGHASEPTKTAILFVQENFDSLAERDGVRHEDFLAARVCFQTARRFRLKCPIQTDCGFTLMIQDRLGRKTETEYEGIPARRALERDLLDRLRRKPVMRGWSCERRADVASL